MNLAFVDFDHDVIIVSDGVHALYRKMDGERENITEAICTDKAKIAKLDSAVRFPSNKLMGRITVDRERLIELLKSIDGASTEISIYKDVRPDYENSNLIAMSGENKAAAVIAVVLKNDFWRPFEK
jgi:hypothetical protein